MDFAEWLKKFTSVKTTLSEPMKKHTGYGVGGAADYFVECFSVRDLRETIYAAKAFGLPVKLLGNGTNVLFSDKGFRGCVISLKGLNTLKAENGAVFAACGVSLAALSDFCVKNGFTGAEAISGIPATIGGALKMNASAYGQSVSDYLVCANVLDGDKFKTLSKEECGFRYRESDVIKGDRAVLSASFAFPKKDYLTVKRLTEEYRNRRKDSQPCGCKSCGSVFKNPDGDFAGRIIDEAGLKGLTCGGAKVSVKHGNFIVTETGATAQDVYTLVNEIKSVIKKEKNVILTEEIEFIGEF